MFTLRLLHLLHTERAAALAALGTALEDADDGRRHGHHLLESTREGREGFFQRFCSVVLEEKERETHDEVKEDEENSKVEKEKNRC